MPKKKQALPTPKAKLYTEDAALLVPIFQKEPFITFQELQDKYGDILTDQQIYRGLLGTFSPYVSERREEAFQEQLLQAKQAALQLEILSHPVGGSLTMPETEVQSLARASFKSMLDGMPAGMACYITCAVNAMYAGDVSGLKNEPLSERMLLSSANQSPLEKYSMQTDSIFRNLPRLLPEYQLACQAQGIDWAVPSEEHQQEVMSVIYDDIKQGKRADMAKFGAAVHDLKKQGCDMAVLGCTELSLVKRDEHLGKFFIDSTEVLCRHALEACGVKPIGF